MAELSPGTAYWVNKDKLSQLYATVIATRKMGLFATPEGIWFDHYEYLTIDAVKPKLIEIVKYRTIQSGELRAINGRPPKESLHRLIDEGYLVPMSEDEYAKILLAEGST